MTRRRAAACGAAVALSWLLYGWLLLPQCALHLDEASYLTADLGRQAWFDGAYTAADGLRRPLDRWTRDSILQYWGFSVFDCHPFLLRLLTGLALTAWPDGPPLLVWRLPNLLLVALAWGMLTATAARLWGGAAATAAAAGLLFSPRVARYALLATHDPTMLAVTVLALLTAWRFAGGRHAWLVAGAVFLLWAGKINALPVALLLVCWGWLTGQGRRLLLCVLAGTLAWLLLEPQFWFERAAQMRQMFGYHLLHRTYPLQLLGRTVMDGRQVMLYPLMQLLSALPLAQLLALGTGMLCYRQAGGTGRRLLLLVLVQLGGNLALAMSPFAPKYAGIRLFLYVFPCVALVVAYGASRLWHSVRGSVPRALLAALLLLPLVSGWWLSPGSALYAGELFGGARGWARLGNEVFAEYLNLTPAIIADAAAQVRGNGRLLVEPYPPFLVRLYGRAGIRGLSELAQEAPAPGDLLLLPVTHLPVPENRALCPLQVYQAGGMTVARLCRVE